MNYTLKIAHKVCEFFEILIHTYVNLPFSILVRKKCHQTEQNDRNKINLVLVIKANNEVADNLQSSLDEKLTDYEKFDSRTLKLLSNYLKLLHHFVT